MRGPRIMRATAQELEEIREIDAREFPEAEFPEASIFWVVDNDPEIGYCAAEVGFDPVRPPGAPLVLHLTRGVVGEDHQGQGLQLRMIRHRLRWGRRLDVTRAQTYTHHDNAASMRTLGRAGFIVLRCRAGYIRWEREI